MTVEIRHLRCFLAICEAGTISSAARAMAMSQSAMSRSLKQLEIQLGTELISRSTHHLSPTDAGTRFLATAERAVQAFDFALVSAVNDRTPLRVGESWSTVAHLAPIQREWDRLHPDLPLVVRPGEEQTGGLVDGTIDVALYRSGTPADASVRTAGERRKPRPDRGFYSALIDKENRVAVLWSGDALANKSEIRLSDLTDRTLVHARSGTTTLDLWPVDIRPGEVVEVGDTDAWLLAIASGRGFGITVESTAILRPHPEVRYVPMVGVDQVGLFVAWPAVGAHHDVSEFVRIATENRRP